MLDVHLRHKLGSFTLDAAFTAPTPGVVALFGRSGCGKTTLVNLLAGLLQAQQGQVRLGDDTWLDTARGIDVPAEQRRAGYVFQDARLFPHYSVRGNLLYGARRARGTAPADIGFDEVVALLGLSALLGRRPASLSGGEKQRVALARALLARPRLLLLDEPLASLDAARRDEVLPYLERLRDSLAIPMVLVSHQFDEVLRLATHVVVLDAGRVVAAGDVTTVSLAPALRAIVGSNAIGAVVDGVVQKVAGELADITVGSGQLRVPCPGAAPGMAMRVQLLARDIILATQEPQGLSVRNQLRGTIRSIVDDTDSDLVDVDIGGASVLARVTHDATRELALAAGRSVWVLVKAVSTRGHAFRAPRLLPLLLTLLAAFAMAPALRAAPAEHVDVSPSDEDAAALRERSHPDNLLERWHDRLYLAVQDFIARTDARFVGPDQTPLPVPASPFRIGMESDVILRDGSTLEVAPRVDVDLLLQLPNLERRLRLFVTSDTIEESPRVLGGASNAVRAGLRLTPLHYFDFDVGIRADVPPVAFTSLRWQRNYTWGNWQLQPLAKVYLETDKGLGVATGASFEHWRERWVFRSASYANWLKDQHDTEFTQSFTFAHAQEIIRFGRYSQVIDGRDFARGYGLQLLASGTHDTGTQRYEASFFYKQPTQTRWLYWHIAPLVSWERQYGWHPDPGIRIGIDALFWDVSGGR